MNRASHRGDRVLLIGGAGYIGSALLPKLLEKGYAVRVMDLLLFGTEPIEGVMTHPQLEVVQADIRHREELARALRDVDAVIHLGAIVGDQACAIDEKLTVEINLLATEELAQAARNAGVPRFLFASTCSVYGASDQTLDENSELSPISLYAETKRDAERVLLRMAGDNFAPTILRFATLYGLSGRTRFDLVVNLLTAKAIVEGQIPVFGGNQWRPFLHSDDCARAILLTLEAPIATVGNDVFNIGSDDQNYTIQQVAEEVHRLIPAARLSIMENHQDTRNYRVAFGKLRRGLGFTPRWTVEQGIRQVAEAFERGRVRDYRDARHNNFKFLSECRHSLVPHVNGKTQTGGQASSLPINAVSVRAG